jgi:hypothetical protein
VIYLFHGSDSEKARRQAFAFVEAARKKQSNLAYVRLAREELSESALEEVVSAGGLFVSRLLVLIDDPFPIAKKTEDDDEQSTESGSLLEDYLDTLAKSDNAVVILAPKLNAAKAKKFIAKAEKEYKFDKAALSESKGGFNSGLVNALGARDGKKLWLEVVRALEAGDAPEAVHGLLHWKARDILEKGSRSWRAGEARALSLDLISLLMDSRRSGLDLSESLERFSLSI